MARVLLAWELGAGLGHVSALAAMGRELAAAGHECAYALRDLAGAHALLDITREQLWQAPLFLPTYRSGDAAHTYADILANIGWRNPSSLAGMISAWKRVYADFRPDLVVFDHAPTAQAAARALDIRRVMLARSGFTLPPAVAPMPLLRADDASAACSREHAVRDTLNAALGRHRTAPVEHLGDLFAADARVLLSVPALDPYGPRDDVEYWGPLEQAGGAAPAWPAAAGQKIFAYVRPFPALPALLELFAALATPVLAHVVGMSAAECARRSTATLCLSPTLIDVPRALAECDLVVSHGGSLAAEALVAGKPQLLLPLHLEQQLTAARIDALSAGLSVPLAPREMQHALARLLAGDQYPRAALALSKRLVRESRPDAFAALAARVLE